MPGPISVVSEFKSLFPDTCVEQVYMPAQQAFEMGSLAAVASALSAIICVYCAYVCLTDLKIKMDGRFLFIMSISAVCSRIMFAIAWTMLSTGNPVTVAV